VNKELLWNYGNGVNYRRTYQISKAFPKYKDTSRPMPLNKFKMIHNLKEEKYCGHLGMSEYFELK
jgi:hypothetical protein